MQWVDERNSPRASGQKHLSPTGTPQAHGKSLGLVWDKVSGSTPSLRAGGPGPGQAGGDTQHLGTFVAVTSPTAPVSANLGVPNQRIATPRTPFVQCTLQSVWVEGGYFAHFMG